MNTIAIRTTGTNTLTLTERILRVAVGSAFIGTILTTTTTALGWNALLPLIGSYAVLSGMTGTGILRSFIDDKGALYRGIQLLISVALISTVFIVNSEPLGLLAILPITGIYAALAALLGQSPVNSVIDAARVIPHIVIQPDLFADAPQARRAA